MSILLSISSTQLVYDPLALLNGRRAIMSWLGDLQPIHRHIVVRSGEGLGFVAVSEKYPSMIRAIWEPLLCETQDAFASPDCTLVFGCICSVMRCNAPTHLLRALHLSLLLFQEIQYDSWKSGSGIHLPICWFYSFAYWTIGWSSTVWVKSYQDSSRGPQCVL